MKELFYHTPHQEVASSPNKISKKTGKAVASKKVKRTTVCGLVSEDGKRVSIGLATCGLKDQFEKAIGRKIARGRAAKKGIVFEFPEGEDARQFFIDKAKELAGIAETEHAHRPTY